MVLSAISTQRLIQVHHDWDKGKQGRYNYREGYSDKPDRAIVFDVIEPQRLKCAAKTMIKVKAHHNHAHHVQDHKPSLRVGRIHNSKKIFYLITIIVGHWDIAKMRMVHIYF